ncbi:MAG: GNAT family protein [Pseudomonadota bacterium]
MFGFTSKKAVWAQGTRVYLRRPERSDSKAWVALRASSSQFLQPREPRWDSDHLSRAWYLRYLHRIQHTMRSEQSLNMLIFLHDSDVLVGAINAANVRYGPFCCADIGYWVGVNYARRGLMSEGLELFIPQCFETLRLKRIQALCMDDNIASQKLLRKNRFQHEGDIRRAMCIDGQWVDHQLYGRINTD